MRQDGDQVRMEEDEARAASTPHVTRWVLGFSLTGAIVLLTAIWVIGAWSSDQNTHRADTPIRAEQKATGGANDSIVSDHADEMRTANPSGNTEPLNMPNKNADGQ